MAADEPARPAWQNQQEQQPIGQAQPVPVLTVQQPQVQNMLVMVYDPASGQYVQKMMPMQLDPATGNYVPAQAQPAAAPTTTKAQEREAEKQRKAAEKPRRNVRRKNAGSTRMNCAKNVPRVPERTTHCWGACRIRRLAPRPAK